MIAVIGPISRADGRCRQRRRRRQPQMTRRVRSGVGGRASARTNAASPAPAAVARSVSFLFNEIAEIPAIIAISDSAILPARPHSAVLAHNRGERGGRRRGEMPTESTTRKATRRWGLQAVWRNRQSSVLSSHCQQKERSVMVLLARESSWKPCQWPGADRGQARPLVVRRTRTIAVTRLRRLGRLSRSTVTQVTVRIMIGSPSHRAVSRGAVGPGAAASAAAVDSDGYHHGAARRGPRSRSR